MMSIFFSCYLSFCFFPFPCFVAVVFVCLCFCLAASLSPCLLVSSFFLSPFLPPSFPLFFPPFRPPSLLPLPPSLPPLLFLAADLHNRSFVLLSLPHTRIVTVDGAASYVVLSIFPLIHFFFPNAESMICGL